MSTPPTLRATRSVRVGNTVIGGGAPIAGAEHVRDQDARHRRHGGAGEQLRRAGAGVVRIAVDNDKEVAALQEIRRADDRQPGGRPAGELPAGRPRSPPTSTRSATTPATCTTTSATRRIADKVAVAGSAWRGDNDCALRIGVNCGSVAPEFLDQLPRRPARARWCTRRCTTASCSSASASRATSYR